MERCIKAIIMVNFQLYTSSYFDSLNYQLDEDQKAFTSGIKECIHDNRNLEDPVKQIVVIIFEGKPIGFFLLDWGTDKFKLTDNTDAVLLRSFSINPDYQGKGIAKKAMNEVSNYAKSIFPAVSELVLSVNMKNQIAHNVYLKAGFTDNGKTIEGKFGPQHVLSKKIT